ncbi:hypothetical protein [Frankia sp. CiP3]|uniref:hypothetical protein n=1 Tax=Frankia sp. CiP3 TaxID=2880971 RepID=UPI001EF3E18F|nr:hypothetical protein [Frankia sp. CiP3]
MPSPAPLPPPPPPPLAPAVGPGVLPDPAQVAVDLAHRLTELAADWWLPLGVPAVVLLTTAVLARGRIRAARHRHLADGARTVEILSPPEVHPEAAAVFWGQMTGLLRPPWQRLVHGQPHLGWELLAGQAGTTIRLWVPGPVPPGMVERAVQAAWPGARTTTRPATSPLPRGVLAVGGQLRLARPDVLPLRADPGGDPVRALLAAVSELDDDETAVVQILARPVTGRRLALARRAAARQRGQYVPSPFSRLLDAVTPRTGRRPDPGAVVRRAGPTPPEESAASRAIGLKTVQPRWEASCTYTAATASQPGDRAARRAAVAALRGRAHAMAATYQLYAGHNYLRRLTLPDPAGVLAARRLHRGDLLAVDELAALAHLPYDTAVPGLTRAGAAAVAPPAGIPHSGADVKVIGDAEAGRRRPVGLTVAITSTCSAPPAPANPPCSPT